MQRILLVILGVALMGGGFFAGRTTAPKTAAPAKVEGLSDLLPDDLVGAIQDEAQREKLLQLWPQLSAIVTDTTKEIAIVDAAEFPSPFPEDFPKPPFFGLKAAPEGVGFPDTSLIQGGDALEAARGGWVVMNVWASWCAPCVAELPDIAEAIAALGTEEVSIHVVNADATGTDTPDSARKLMDERGAASIPLLFVDGKRNTRAFTSAIFEDPNRQSYPYTVIYAPGGKPYAIFAGGPVDGGEVWASEDGLAFFRALETLDI